jgi:hypothetical protein
MKKSIEKFGDLEIVWKRVLNIGPQDHGLNFLFGKNNENVIGFIDGWGWSRRETNRVRVHVLSPRNKGWGSLLVDSTKFLEDLKKCVRIILKDSDGKSDIEVKNITYTWAHV